LVINLLHDRHPILHPNVKSGVFFMEYTLNYSFPK